MSVRFAYRLIPATAPVIAVHGRGSRPRPMTSVELIGPARTLDVPCLVDTGADDTVFPEALAAAAGLDLTGALEVHAGGVGGRKQRVRFVDARLRLFDGQTAHEWPATVGFTSALSSHALLGFAGCLEYFTATFDGERRVVELTPNALYPGT